MTKIGIFVGSRRNGSWNQKVADDLTTLLPETFETCQIEIHNLPFYESEWDQPETLPEPVRIARKIAEECDGFHLHHSRIQPVDPGGHQECSGHPVTPIRLHSLHRQANPDRHCHAGRHGRFRR